VTSKIWNQNHTQKIGLSSRELRQTFIDRRNGSFQWRTLHYFDQQSSKGKKGTIAMIAGTKAQTVIAIIEKYRLNYEIQFLR
jgi:hypothetical protein